MVREYARLDIIREKIPFMRPKGQRKIPFVCPKVWRAEARIQEQMTKRLLSRALREG